MRMEAELSYLARIRGVELLPGERVGAIFHTEQGPVAEPGPSGRLLVATNRRLISAGEEGRVRDTLMFPTASICGASVHCDARRGLSWKQWAALLVGGLAVYLAAAYWLVGRLPEVIIPVVNLHAAAALLAALIVLLGWLYWRSLTRPGGFVLRIAGVNWTLDVPCYAASDDLLSFANTLLLLQSAAGRCRYAPDADGDYSGCPKGRDGSTSRDRSAMSPRRY